MFFESDRIYSRKILADRLVVTLERENSVAEQQVYITVPKKEYVSTSFLAGIMGSGLMAFFIRTFYDETKDAFPQIKVAQLKALPFRIPHESDERLTDIQKNIESFVEQIFTINRQFTAAKSTGHKDTIQRHIEAIDTQIDHLVYALYGLTEEEIAIVEGNVSEQGN